MGSKAPTPMPADYLSNAVPSTVAPPPKKPDAADVARRIWNATIGLQNRMHQQPDGTIVPLGR